MIEILEKLTDKTTTVKVSFTEAQYNCKMRNLQLILFSVLCQFNRRRVLDSDDDDDY